MHTTAFKHADPRSIFIAFALIFLAINFNFFFAIINAHVFRITSAYIILAEILLFAGAFYLSIKNYNEQMRMIYVLQIFLVCNFFALCLINGDFNPKALRDLLIGPAFIICGMVAAEGRFLRFFAILQGFICVVAFVEIYFVDYYTSFVNPKQFYIDSRGRTEESFWMEGSQLYQSAYRPTGRLLFPSLDWHRVSSVFLEPVSFANVLIGCTIATFAFWPRMDTKTQIYFGGTLLFMMVAADGRLATVTMILLLAVSIGRNALPRYVNIAYPFIIIAIAVSIVIVLNATGNVDNFAGRLTKSVTMLNELGMDIFTGNFSSKFHDSGYTKIIASSGIFGALAWWLILMSRAEQRTPTTRYIVHAVAIFYALSFSVSSTAFSIKSAALMWFLVGLAVALDRQKVEQEEERNDRRPMVASRWTTMEPARGTFAVSRTRSAIPTR